MSLVKRNISLSAVKVIAGFENQIPQLRCQVCSLLIRPVLYQVTQEEWLQAAHQVGWRQVEDNGHFFEAVCPHCITKLDNQSSR